MGQDFFRFKQFTVYHNLCAMKVGIDGVLLGAWADVSSAGSVLDIGTGSGLIALMLAQRSEALIHAIDIDEGAVMQSRLNFSRSPWPARLSVGQVSVQIFSETSDKRFDLIVSNPPFFVNALKTPDKQRTTARHTETLTHEELLRSAQKLLNKTGRICLILPVEEGIKCIKFAQTLGLQCNRLVSVFPKPGTQVKRLLIELSYQTSTCIESSLTVESDVRHSYSAEFTALARNFYLKL